MQHDSNMIGQVRTHKYEKCHLKYLKQVKGRRPRRSSYLRFGSMNRKPAVVFADAPLTAKALLYCQLLGVKIPLTGILYSETNIVGYDLETM